METVLIDTSIFIGRMRREPAAFTASERLAGSQPVICDVVLAEILAGARNKAEFARHHASSRPTSTSCPSPWK